jgi:hypothetical protein
MPAVNQNIIKQAYDPSPETTIVEWEEVEWVFYDNKPIVALGNKKALPAEYCHPEPGYNVGRCTMIKVDGKRCPNPVREGWRVCRYHGAGGLANPGGGMPRHAKFLPTRLADRFQEFMADPDALALYSEMALVDSRITELTERLETCDNRLAWSKVDQAMLLIYKLGGLHESIDRAYQLLKQAKAAPAEEKEIWREINQLLETRRRLAQTEQNRIINAKQYLSLSEANAMLASVMEIVMNNVNDPTTRQLIATKLRETIKD